MWGNINMAVRKPGSSRTKTLRPSREFNINCNPPTPLKVRICLSMKSKNQVNQSDKIEGVNGGGGPFDGWRLKINRFDGWRLTFRSFDGWRLIFRNDVYHTNLKHPFDCFNKTICFFSYLNLRFNPIICALKRRLLVFNYGNCVYY